MQNHVGEAVLSDSDNDGFDAAELERIRARRAESDRVSAEMGRLLLQGWAMLDQNCPICVTPLMRSRGGELFCVCCNMPVRRTEDAAAAAADASARELAAPDAVASTSQQASLTPPTDPSADQPFGTLIQHVRGRAPIELLQPVGRANTQAGGQGSRSLQQPLLLPHRSAVAGPVVTPRGPATRAPAEPTQGPGAPVSTAVETQGGDSSNDGAEVAKLGDHGPEGQSAAASGCHEDIGRPAQRSLPVCSSADAPAVMDYVAAVLINKMQQAAIALEQVDVSDTVQCYNMASLLQALSTAYSTVQQSR